MWSKVYVNLALKDLYASLTDPPIRIVWTGWSAKDYQALGTDKVK